ncbi:hypothetical protein V9T40_000526 [Parthenolecanium corni]|uniref:Major facilitator superfamily (MFS) profile domain-containing protein n=1 Tax=Parthenolecanium corni TaxID=536013 RepID=A0AAN9Y0J0_9HEMI
MVAFISLVISVIGFIQTCFLKETKYWHLYKNNVEKAKESIKWFDNSLTESEIQAEIDEILSTDNQLNNRQVNVIAAFKNRTNLKYFTFGFLLLTFIYGCGRVQITAHPHNYYNQFQLPVDNSVITLIQGILELIMSVFYTLIVDTVPRKTMLRCCCGLMNACLMVALFHDILATSCGLIGQWILLVVLMVFYGVSCGFLFSLTTIMVSEIVSVTTEARAVFQSLLYVWVNLISGVYSEVFPFALEAIPVNYIILFFFINVALLLLTGFLVPETRGKALHLCSAGKETKVSNKNTNSATEKV